MRAGSSPSLPSRASVHHHPSARLLVGRAPGKAAHDALLMQSVGTGPCCGKTQAGAAAAYTTHCAAADSGLTHPGAGMASGLKQARMRALKALRPPLGGAMAASSCMSRTNLGSQRWRSYLQGAKEQPCNAVSGGVAARGAHQSSACHSFCRRGG